MVSDAGDDADLASGDDDDDDYVPPPRPRQDDGGVRPRELVLLAVTVLAIAGTVFFGLRWKDLHDEEVGQQDVETAASQFLNAIFEWDGTTINEDFDRILTFATGQFEEEARATFADDATRQQLTENRAAERAKEVDVFVQSIEGDDARVFGVVQVEATNINLPVPRVDTVRVEVGMTREDGEWKVYDFNVFDGLSLGLPLEPTDAATGGSTPTTVPS